MAKRSLSLHTPGPREQGAWEEPWRGCRKPGGLGPSSTPLPRLILAVPTLRTDSKPSRAPSCKLRALPSGEQAFVLPTLSASSRSRRESGPSELTEEASRETETKATKALSASFRNLLKMVLGLRTLAKGVRGGACAIGGAVKAVAAPAVGGVLGAVLVVSLAQAPQLLVPGILGVAAAKAVLGSNQKREAEAENEEGTAGPVAGGAESAPEAGEAESCEGGTMGAQGVAETRRSSSEKGSVQEPSGCRVQSLLRSLSDGALDVSEEEGESSGLPLEQQEVLAEEVQGEGEKVYRDSNQGQPLPQQCLLHQPHGVCYGCSTFTGTGQEFLAWVKGEDSTLLEVWVVAILKHAATVLAAMHSRGVCIQSLRPANIVLKEFPILGRHPTLEHVHLAGDLFEIPKTALPLATKAVNVYWLGLAASELLGNSSPFTDALLAAMLRAEPWARPTAAELCALLAQHALLT